MLVLYVRKAFIKLCKTFDSLLYAFDPIFVKVHVRILLGYKDLLRRWTIWFKVSLSLRTRWFHTSPCCAVVGGCWHDESLSGLSHKRRHINIIKTSIHVLRWEKVYIKYIIVANHGQYVQSFHIWRKPCMDRGLRWKPLTSILCSVVNYTADF